MKLPLRKLIYPLVRVHNLRASCVFYSMSTKYKEDKIKVGKYNINYLKVGHGAHSVLCLPGAMGSIWTDFKPQVEGFDREKFSLIIWDAPGYGRSRPPEREFHTNYFAQDVDIAFEFMKVLNISKFSLMGWSYGSATSLRLAARYPQVMQKMVIWGASFFVMPKEMDVYKSLKDVNTWSDKKRKPMIELYGEETFAKLWARVVEAMDAECGIEKVTDECAIFKNVNCPTLLLYGEKDRLVDKSHFPIIRDTIQGCRVHLYPEGRHDVHIQYAEDFNQRVQEFLIEN